MNEPSEATPKRFYMFANLAILLFFALAISLFFVSSYRATAEKHYQELREEVLRSKHEFIRNAVERTVQVIDLQRSRCLSARGESCDEEAVKAWLHDYIRTLRLKDDGYLWINAVRDYAGGDGYAYRFVHPNLPETEGMPLSTGMQDIKGNTPYLTELEGVKKDGEIFFDYWFKKMDSEVIQHKLTFAKLYKPYDWIVATGVYLDDVDALAQSRMLAWGKYTRRNILWALSITAVASLLAWFCSLLVGKKAQATYGYLLGEVDKREDALRRLNRDLEQKVLIRTREIEASEKRYLDLYENAPDMYVSVDAATGRIEGCNLTLCSVLGYERQELLGQPVLKLYHPDCLEEAQKTFELFRDSGEIHDRELILMKKDGVRLHASLSVAAVKDETGRVRYSRSTLRDITERKRNDAINAARLRLMQFAAVHGLDEFQEEALNEVEKLTDSRIGFFHLVDEDQAFLTLQAWSSRTKADFCRVAEQSAHYPIEQAGVWVDCVKQRRPVIHNDYAALPHRKGLPEGHPEVLRELVAPIMRRGLIKSVIGVGNKPIDYNGKDVETVQLLGDLMWEIVERKQVEEERRALYEELEQRVTERTATLGETQMALMNIVEDLNEKTEELKGANEKLLDLDRLKSLFIASMSHELRTPLNSIIGFSSILLNEWTGPLNDEQKENIASVLRSGKHLLSLINDVIDVSKVEVGEIESLVEETRLETLIDEAVSMVALEAEKKGLKLRVQAEPCRLYTDPRRLLQCLLNLLSNAVKFTEQGVIEIGAGLTESGENVEIAVSDTGIGIRKEDLDNLFAPFVRLDSPLRAKILGTGLGLYLTRKLTTEVLGGQISVSSILGQGSRFVLQIPISLRAGGTHE